MSRLDHIRDRLQFARRYTLDLLAATPEADWFRMPDGITHVAYQVGHIAHAEYRLCLLRVRGEQPGDDVVIPPNFVELFGRLYPSPDPANYPPLADIRAALDRVHERVLAELPTFTRFDLDEPVPSTHRLCKTRGEFLEWCPMHEMVHAGQIGLLRRLLGHKPLW